MPFSQFEIINTTGERRVSLPTTAASSPRSASFSTYAPVAASTRSPKATPKAKAKAALKEDYANPLSTHRQSPLVCPNQALCEELAIIMKSRFLEGESMKELSYSRAIAVSMLKDGVYKRCTYILIPAGT